MKFVRRHILKESVELNITAFLNLMVILVPFLLITAVFSRLTVLELNLPPLNAKAAEDEQVKLQLQLVVRDEGMYIQDANLGVIKYIPAGENGYNWKTLTASLIEIKSRFLDEDSITLLLERSVDYKTLIQVMDRVRSADVVQNAELQTVELFPNVSVGDAEEPETGTETDEAAAGASP